MNTNINEPTLLWMLNTAHKIQSKNYCLEKNEIIVQIFKESKVKIKQEYLDIFSLEHELKILIFDNVISDIQKNKFQLIGVNFALSTLMLKQL